MHPSARDSVRFGKTRRGSASFGGGAAGQGMRGGEARVGCGFCHVGTARSRRDAVRGRVRRGDGRGGIGTASSGRYGTAATRCVAGKAPGVWAEVADDVVFLPLTSLCFVLQTCLT